MSVTLTVLQARCSLSLYQQPTSSNGYTLILDFNDDPVAGAAWYEARLDVSTMAPVGPILQLGAASGGAVSLMWSAAAGQKFQVQYKNNLLDSGWLNLGGPLTATTGTVTFSDSPTNAQRFYRLLLVP